jgi:hypothetical protein
MQKRLHPIAPVGKRDIKMVVKRPCDLRHTLAVLARVWFISGLVFVVSDVGAGCGRLHPDKAVAKPVAEG